MSKPNNLPTGIILPMVEETYHKTQVFLFPFSVFLTAAITTSLHVKSAHLLSCTA